MSLAYDALGNIQTWGYQTAKRKEAYNKPYDIELRGLYTQHYTYDNLNRLKTADLDKNGSGVFAMTGSQSGIAYDANGNILAMQRTYNGTVADDLSYTFASNSNRLTSVQDNGTSTFVKNGTNSYTYDANGNLLTDSGKGVTGITYNYLNLPQQITTATGTITYSYTATGQKLRMTVPPSGAEGAKTVDYAAGLVYENNALAFIPTAEGRILPPTKAVNPEVLPGDANALKNSFYRYEYHLKDHLGNLRVACRCAEKAFKTSPADTYPLIAVQENHYDAWGLTLPLVETADKLSGSPEHRFKFLGRESIAETGWVDLMKRQYDPPTGRFISVDPSPDVEGQESITTYQYGWNNPVRFSDPNGDCPFCLVIPLLPEIGAGAVAVGEFIAGTAVGATLGVGLVELVKSGASGGGAYNPAVGFAMSTSRPGEISGIYNSKGRGSEGANNKKKGDEFEKKVTQKLKDEGHSDVAEQITIKPNPDPGGKPPKKVKLDNLSKKDGQLKLTDAKSSEKAPFTPNQEEGYPLIERNGGTVVGKKSAAKGYPEGTKIPPTKVDVIRPKDLQQ